MAERARVQPIAPPKKTGLEKVLDTVERVGNKVPHPAVIFVLLIAAVIVLSHILYLLGFSATYETINPDTHQTEQITTKAQSLLTADGIRFLYAEVVRNFMSFNAVGVIIVAMLGVGVAETSGLIKALIRKLVAGGSASSVDIHPRVRGNCVEHRCRRRVPCLDSTCCCGLPQCRPQSTGWISCIFRRSLRGIQRKYIDQTSGWNPHRNYERRHPSHEPQSFRHANGEFLVFCRLGADAYDCLWVDNRQTDRASHGPVQATKRRPGRRGRGCSCERTARAEVCDLGLNCDSRRCSLCSRFRVGHRCAIRKPAV